MEFLQFDPSVDFKLLLAVPLIPLIGYTIQIFFGRFLPRKGDWLLISGMFVVMSITVLMFAKAMYHVGHSEEPFIKHSGEVGMTWGWLFQAFQSADSPNVVAGILYDGIGASLLMVVGVVSFFVHLFATGYMKGDCRYHIFFANISLFTFAMLGVVLSDNILFFFMFWEVMGLMSYLLIGHFSHDPNSGMFFPWATWACKKAFMTTRVGDTCLLVGMLMFYREFDTFSFTGMWEAARVTVEANGGEYPAWMTVAGLLVFGGTVGKSAQFPLNIWLPDAMAGPTPVSAMIHAATMVAAGVFLLGRMYPLMSPDALAVVTTVGAFTALIAATIGTTANDIKAVLAYSTISQLGFMVASIGVGGLIAGLFHMVTHAFFKACLFLSAGSVIHGCHHEQDMRKMGGLRKPMPVTFFCMIVCTLAISGIPLFSGFYSKDKIIQASFEGAMGDHPSGWAVFASVALPLAAMLTAFYMFRLIFMTFYGENRAVHAVHGEEHGHDAHGDGDHGHDDHGHHEPHESPPAMLISIVVLALLGIFGGHFWLMGDPMAHHGTWFTKLVTYESLFGTKVGAWLEPHHSQELHDSAHSLALVVSLFVALSGIAIAWFLYVKRRDLPGKIYGGLGLIATTVADKYYIDEFIEAVVIKPCLGISKVLRWFDEKVIDGIVLGVGRVNKALGFFSAWFDRVFVDGIVNYIGMASQAFGAAVRLFQTGRIQQYATFAVGGALAAAAWLILA